jgi:LmbE family N-acetylglucosaminyl deacetylase
MQRVSRIAVAVTWLLCLAGGALAQLPVSPLSASNAQIAIERLANTGSVLMIAAHPDDEHTGLLAYLALGRKLRTGYLSLTRGEGGQNVIGPEKGTLLGIIRTEELLAARRIDGGEQYFTSAVDFGFSKTAEETLRIWNREQVVGDAVRVIREFQPDVVVLVWSGTPADGHGHHQASHILGVEAVKAAADASRFPEQQLKPWTTQRTFVLSWKGGAVSIDIGEYDPLLGYSYTELAAISRSQHQSQAMGAPQTVGPSQVGLNPLDTGFSGRDLLDGIATGPARVSPQFAAILSKAIGSFDPKRPHEVVPMLLNARRALRGLEGDLVARKLREIDEAIALCAGIMLEAAAQRPYSQAGAKMQLKVQAVNRSPIPIRFERVEVAGAGSLPALDLLPNRPLEQDVTWSVPTRLTPAVFRLTAGGESLVLTRPVVYRYVDPVYGDRAQPFAVTPPVGVEFANSAELFRDSTPRDLLVRVKSFAGAVEGTVTLELPQAWTAVPAQQEFKIERDGAEAAVQFRVTPPEVAAVADIRASATVAGTRTSASVMTIRHPHIPTQMVVQPSATRLVRADVRVLAKTVGYIEGAGDDVPAALRQMGCDVKILSQDELASGNLRAYDAIVTGVRAFNVRDDLAGQIGRLNDYVRNGGTLVVQYNTASDRLGPLGPFPLKIGRSRVSMEQAPVSILNAGHPLLRAPNSITSADFEGWVQERGLYFPTDWGQQLQPVIASNDPGEKPLPGGILMGKYGEGVYIYTSYSWFRQLPAGVPGAYRLFANMLSQ